MMDHASQIITNTWSENPSEASHFNPAKAYEPSLPSTSTADSVLPNANPPSVGFHQASPANIYFNALPQVVDDWFPSDSQVTRGIDIFFNYVSPYFPFLHQPTFDATSIPSHLLFSLLCLAYQHGDDPDCSDEASSGASLSLRCFNRVRVLIACDEEWVDNPTQNVTLVQAYLLLQVYSMMYLCGKDSSYSLTTHSKMISLARATGLMQPIQLDPAGTKDLESLWREFIRSESHKRTFYAVHRIDTLWYMFLSTPRQLSHLEIKHSLPCPDDHWTASSAGEWAHRQLISTHNSASSLQYPDAIRRFLSPDTSLHTIPQFDPYGATNIIHFLVSSAREISGWSTMTGMVGVERLEPLRASLLALGPYIRSESEISTTPHRVLCEATWESAMLELQMWSPTHTGGIVEGSMDAVLHQLTCLAPSSELLCEPSMAQIVQPHVDWFLRYLDATFSTDFEAPWMTLYVYKAFMVAWQLLRGGSVGAMQVVNVDDGDTDGALKWARKVFHRRQRWKLGKIIMECLNMLES